MLLDAAKVILKTAIPYRRVDRSAPTPKCADTAVSSEIGRELLHAKEIHAIMRPRLRRLCKRVQDTYSERRHHG